MMRDRVVGVTRDVENAQVRSSDEKAFGEITAAHSWQDDVSQQQVNLAVVVLQN